MARKFVLGSSQYLTSSTAPVSGPPMSVSCWLFPNNTAVDQECAAITDNSAGNADAIRLEIDWSAGGWGLSPRHASTQTGINTNTMPTGSTWNHIGGCLIVAGNTGTLYLNGTKPTLAASTYTTGTTGLAVSSIGAYISSTNVVNPSSAIIADFAIWNIALTDAEFFALAKGVRPGNIRPASLVRWYPLDGI